MNSLKSLTMTTQELKAKILAEIECLEHIDYPCDNYEQSVGFYNALDRIKSFINSIPDEEEQEPISVDEAMRELDEKIALVKKNGSWQNPELLDEMRGKECEGLEEAADEYSNNNEYMDVGFCVEPVYIGHKMEKAFIAGAKWQKEQDQPITGNSLEQEWLRYVDKKKKEYGGELPSLGEYGWLQIARHFANWQKEQMMKEAVEGRVFMSFAPGHNQVVMADVDLPTSTNVRVIVLPKED